MWSPPGRIWSLPSVYLTTNVINKDKADQSEKHLSSNSLLIFRNVWTSRLLPGHGRLHLGPHRLQGRTGAFLDCKCCGWCRCWWIPPARRRSRFQTKLCWMSSCWSCPPASCGSSQDARLSRSLIICTYCLRHLLPRCSDEMMIFCYLMLPSQAVVSSYHIHSSVIIC